MDNSFSIIFDTIQKNRNAINDSINLMKFIDNKSFRPTNRNEKNIYESLLGFQEKVLTILKFFSKQSIEIQLQILHAIKEILKEISDSGRKKLYVFYNPEHGGETGTGSMEKSVVNVCNKSISITSNTQYNYEQQEDGKKENLWKKILDSALNTVISKSLGKLIDSIFDKIFGKAVDKLGNEIIGSILDGVIGGLLQGLFKGKTSSGDSPASEDVYSRIKGNSISHISSLIRSLKNLLDMVSEAASLAAGSFENMAVIGIRNFVMLSAAAGIYNFMLVILRNSLSAVTAAQLGCNEAMLANPVLKLVADIFQLISAIILFAQNILVASTAFLDLWNTVISIFSGIIGWLQEHLINPIFEHIPDWLKDLLGIGNIESSGGGGNFGGGGSDGILPYSFPGGGSSRGGGSSGKLGYYPGKISGGNTFNITINGVNKSTSEIINDLVAGIKEAANTMGEVAFV